MTKKYRSFGLILFIFQLLSFGLVSNILYAGDSLVSGFVHDANTGEPLLAATVQIKDTFTGTITNASGEFELRVRSYPAQLLFRFIGYETVEINLETPPEGSISIQMKPLAVTMREVVVTGEDPALQIMREVIARKEVWRAQLKTYKAEAYTRQRVENDDGIVSISETLSNAYWDHFRGTREVLVYRKQTQNVDPAQNFAAATFVPNFYDDDIRIFGYDLVGVTHPNALSFYHFRLEGFRELDGKTVYDISVRPRRRLQPTFEGKIAVLDEDYALIEVDLRPSESVIFPPPIQELGFSYRQQFSNFGQDFWLPVDVRIEGIARIGFPGLQFPPIIFNQLSRLTNYEINVPLPDSLYRIQRRLSVDTVAIATREHTIDTSGISVPLDARETEAYEKLDSSDTFERAFAPSGALARFVDMGDQSEREQSAFSAAFGKVFNGVSPKLGFNRVDAFRLGAEYRLPIEGKLRTYLKGIYLTGTGDVDYGARMRYITGNPKRLNFELKYIYQTINRFGESQYDPFFSSGSMILGGPDYFDYFKQESFSFQAEARFYRNYRWAASIGQSEYKSLTKVTNYSIPGGVIQRENPPIDEGTDRLIAARFTYGESRVPFGFTGSQSFAVELSHSAFWANSDFNYTRLLLQFDWRFETFYKRRFMPNTLDIRVNLGTTIGELPLQKWHGIDTSISYFMPFGVFKTSSGRPFEGEHIAAVFWEHNFKTIPFEALRMMNVARKGVGIIVFGAHGYTHSGQSFDNEPGFQGGYLSAIPSAFGGSYHEFGISLNGLFSLMRLDAAFRVDSPGFYAGLSVARIF